MPKGQEVGRRQEVRSGQEVRGTDEDLRADSVEPRGEGVIMGHGAENVVRRGGAGFMG